MVLPTPGGPDSRAALNPEPSSFPPPNLPNLAAAQWGGEVEKTPGYQEKSAVLRRTSGRAATCRLGGPSAVVPVPVLQPALQLVGAALLPLLADHGLQRARPVLVHPQQTGVLAIGSRRLGGGGVGGGGRGGQVQLPASRVGRAPAWGGAAVLGPGGVAQGLAGLGGAGCVRGRGVALRGRDLVGRGGDLGAPAWGGLGL